MRKSTPFFYAATSGQKARYLIEMQGNVSPCEDLFDAIDHFAHRYSIGQWTRGQGDCYYYTHSTNGQSGRQASRDLTKCETRELEDHFNNRFSYLFNPKSFQPWRSATRIYVWVDESIPKDPYRVLFPILNNSLNEELKHHYGPTLKKIAETIANTLPIEIFQPISPQQHYWTEPHPGLLTKTSRPLTKLEEQEFADHFYRDVTFLDRP